MAGTFVFVHGTGVQNADDNKARIEAQLRRRSYFDGWSAICPAWGDEVGPPDLDIGPALPPARGERLGTMNPETAIAAFAAEFYGRSVAASGDVAAERIPAFALRILTDLLEKYRVSITNPVVDFIRNVFYYLREDALVQSFVDKAIDEALAAAKGPVVVAGHSLGGIIALDVLSQRPRDVRLLITAGSQSPLFYLMGVTRSIHRDPPPNDPVAPWLNVYNPRDPLAFYASAVFDWAQRSPIDEKLEVPEDLLPAHTGYFEEAGLYALVERYLKNPAAGDSL